MGYFARGEGEDDVERAEALARIEDGGIPTAAKARLKALGAAGSLYTSGLSVNEFALLELLGPRPVAQVMGASVVRVGWQYLPALEPGTVMLTGQWYAPTPTGRGLQNRYTEASMSQVRSYRWHSEVVCELDELSDAWNMARRRALNRLAEEALQVRADAVVGVHLRRSAHDLGARTIEYIVTGTAVRHPTSTGTAWPVITDLSVQDYWQLHSAGHEPVGLAATTTVLFASPPRTTAVRRARTTAQNQELDELSKAFQAARDTVRARLLGQVSDAHGEGAVGVEFSHSVRREKLALASSLASRSNRGWQRGRLGMPYFVSGHSDVDRRGWVITMHAAGTAVRRRRDPSAWPVKTALGMGGT